MRFSERIVGPLLWCLLLSTGGLYSSTEGRLQDQGWKGKFRDSYAPQPSQSQSMAQSQKYAKLIMADVINRLGVKLLAIQNEFNENNIAISPYGALSVLVALGEGLQGGAVQEIQLAAQIPNDISIIRLGLRDINRHLQSYFIPKEGFLAGLTLSYDSVPLKPLYQDILLYYGYDLTAFNVAFYPSPPKLPPPESTTSVDTTSVTPIATSTITTPTTAISTTTEVVTQASVPTTTSTSTQIFDSITTLATPLATGTTVSDAMSTTSPTTPDIRSATVPITSDTTSTTILTDSDTMMSTTIPTTMGTSEPSPGGPNSTSTITISTITPAPFNINDTEITTKPMTIPNQTTTIRSSHLAPFNLTKLELRDFDDLSLVSTEIASSSFELTPVPANTNLPSTDSSQPLSSSTTIPPGVSSTVDLSTTQSTTTQALESITPPKETSADSTPELLASVPTEAMTEQITEQQVLTTGAATTEITEPQVTTAEAMTSGTAEQQVMTGAMTTETAEQQVTTTGAMTAVTTEQLITTVAITEGITEVQVTTVDTTEQQVTTTGAMAAGTTVQEDTTGESTEQQTTTTGATAPEIVTAGETTMATMEDAATTMEFAGSSKEKRMTPPSSVSLNKWPWADNRHRRVSRSVSDYDKYQKQLYHTTYNYPRPINPPTSQEPLYFLAQGRYKDYHVDFMRYNTVLPVCNVAHLDARALKFPLDRKEYYLLILLPNRENGVDQLVRDLRFNGDLRQIVDCLRTMHVDVTIPSFKMNGYVKLTTLFQRLGIRKVFEPNQGDFTPMTDQKQIYVTNIEQAITVNIKHYMDIDNITRKNSYPWMFKANHPFLFFVMDSELQVTLMSGKITNPLNTRIS